MKIKSYSLYLCLFGLLGACSTATKVDEVSLINTAISSYPSGNGNVGYGNELQHESGGTVYTWEFQCNNNVCAYGQFVNGDYWVAPVDKGDVTIISVEPFGEENGLVLNPTTGKKQGLLSCQDSSYEPSRNLMTQLPYAISASASLIKADKSEKECGSKSINGCCVASYDVLTVLDAIPEYGGVETFRPGFAGKQKTLYSVHDFDLNILPALTEVNETNRQTPFVEIESRWGSPYFDHLSSELGSLGRAFVPQSVLPIFGATMASSYLQDMISVFGMESNAEKEPAVFALLQRGIDLYASWKVGVTWPSSGGEMVGRKPPLAFLAALTTDPSIKGDVSNMAKYNANVTQEDGQIRVLSNNMGGSGLPVWGDACSEKVYWSQLFFEQKYAGSTGVKIGSGDNKKVCRDPYGLIDGPAGLPGSGYMKNGTFFAFSLAQQLMPELGVANNDPELVGFTNRVLNKGIQTLPDRCAAPDSNESMECKPYKAGAPGCAYYGITWGPDPQNKGQCITNDVAGNGQNGRFPDMDGVSVGKLLYQPLIASKLNDLAIAAAFIAEEEANTVPVKDAVVDIQLPSVQTVIEHVSGGKLFRWEFDCGGEPCLTGQFINGGYWVASKYENQPVVLLSVTPEGIDNGLQANPVYNTKQGFLSCQTDTYDEPLNLMSQLPYSVPPNTSLMKADKREDQCGTKSILGCCVDAYDVVTVVGVVPENNGATVFRPGFAGNNKQYYSVNDFNWALIPSEAKVSNSSHLKPYNEIVDAWSTPYFDHFMEIVGDRGRAFAPASAIHDYGANQAADYLESLLSVFSEDAFDTKAPAVYALLQRGIDLYSSWEQGVKWPNGAGQQMGRKPPMAFFAALVNSEKVKADVSNMAINNGADTHEDGQIRLIPESEGGGNVPVWGDTQGFCGENNYWSMLFNHKEYDGASGIKIGVGDNKKTCGDPYGFIDGPAGLPGTFYMQCCSTGGFNAFVLAQKMMPALETANNDPVLIEYVRRIKEEGIRTLPDMCAPPDPRETDECKPYKAGAIGCSFYRDTWGPDPENPGQCIANGPGQNGRFPHLNGQELTTPLNEPLISRELWLQY